MKIRPPFAKNITQPDKYGYQVRIVRRKVEHSRYFAFNLWGGKKKALNAAISWRDQIKVIKKANTKRFINTASSNKSTGVLGVCKTHCYDHRKDLDYLIYSVSWLDYKGIKRGKSFRVCNVNNYDEKIDRIAFESAKLFRKEWEFHADNDTLHLFNHKKYSNWRNKAL